MPNIINHQRNASQRPPTFLFNGLPTHWESEIAGLVIWSSIAVPHLKCLLCWYIQFQPTPGNNNIFAPGLPFSWMPRPYFCPNCSSRSDFGVAFKATLVILCPGTISSWLTDAFNHTTRTHIAEIAHEWVQMPGFLAGGSDEYFTLGTSAFGFYCGAHITRLSPSTLFSLPAMGCGVVVVVVVHRVLGACVT